MPTCVRLALLVCWTTSAHAFLAARQLAPLHRERGSFPPRAASRRCRSGADGDAASAAPAPRARRRRRCAWAQPRRDPAATLPDAAILDARTLLSTANTDLSSTSEEARETLSSATGVLELLSGPVSPEAEVLYRLTVALEQLAAASDRMGALATYLELHPEALLKGKDD